MTAAGAGRFRGRRILFVEPHPDFATNPTLTAMVDELLAEGASVHVSMPDSAGFPELEAGVVRWPFAAAHSLGGALRAASGRATLAAAHAKALDVLCRAGYFDLVIAINPEGIVAARDALAASSTPLVYLSFEILFADELRGADLRLKAKERAACRRASLAIVQDPARAERLRLENGLGTCPLALLPVAPRSRPRSHDTRYWHRRFGLADDDVVVLHSGSFERWTFDRELLESTSRWDPKLVLVVHCRRTPSRELEGAVPAGARVLFSTDPVPAERYDELVASADIGLLLYNPVRDSKWTGKNIEVLGMASGKFAFYAKYGLPVVTVAHPDLAHTIARYACGRAVDDFSELPAALQDVITRRAELSSGARALFDDIAFERCWPRVASALHAQLSKRSTPPLDLALNTWRGTPGLQPVRRVVSAARRRARARAHPPILIYQVGKVGSTTVYSSLQEAGIDNAVYHVHFLSERGVAEAERAHTDAGWPELPGHLADSRLIRDDMRRFGRVRWKVITLVREHIAFEVSRLFQSPEFFRRDVVDRDGEVSVEAAQCELERALTQHDERHCYYCQWFATEFPSALGLDLLAQPFDPARGFAVYRAPRADVLVMRLESLDDVFESAMVEFLQQSDVPLVKHNERSGTHAAYDRVKRELRLSPAAARAIHRCPVSQRFYSAEERESFVQRWSR